MAEGRIPQYRNLTTPCRKGHTNRRMIEVCINFTTWSPSFGPGPSFIPALTAGKRTPGAMLLQQKENRAGSQKLKGPDTTKQEKKLHQGLRRQKRRRHLPDQNIGEEILRGSPSWKQTETKNGNRQPQRRKDEWDPKEWKSPSL